MERAHSRFGGSTGLIALALSAAILGASAPLSAERREDRPAAFHVDRNTELDRPTVTFLKALLRDAPKDREFVIVLGPDGEVLGSAEGGRSEVDVPGVAAPPTAEGEGLVLVHSHPSSTSFSRADLQHLSRPGVEAMVAIGADGGVYFAARGPRFIVNGIGPLYDKAAEAVNYAWRGGANWHAGPSVRLEPHHAHIISQGLASAGVIVYRASMSFDRERSYFDGTILFALMVEAAACDVRDMLRP